MRNSSVQAGEIEFGTNTAIFYEFGIGNSSQLSSLDVTYQSYNPQTRVLDIQIDPNLAPSAQLNFFNKRTSSLGLSAPAEIIQGSIQLQFSSDWQQIAGTISFLGNGYIQPGISLYQANFAGTLAQTFTGLVEA